MTAAKSWTPAEMPCLLGKVAIVTGANSGIGLHTAKHLALHGAKVYFTARSEAKAITARTEILAQAPSILEHKLVWLQLDLCNLSSIREAVEVFSSSETQLDILVNSAGSLTPKMQTTGCGWEVDMASSYIGHFAFTNGLMPFLKRASSNHSADVRVITIGSNVPTTFLPPNYPIDFTTTALLYGVIPYEPWQWRIFQNKLVNYDMLHYSLAKLANIMFAKELQNRFNDKGLPIISLTLNPGAVKTEGSKGLFKNFMQPMMNFVQSTPDEGSYHTLWAATAKKVREFPQDYGGKYMEPIGKPASSHAITDDSAQLRALWSTTSEDIDKQLSKQGLPGLVDW